MILVGDVREKLRELADGSVHCVVTSPPYWGLRDYQTASWEGGNTECDHQGKPMATKANINRNCGTGNDVKNATAREFFKSVCGNCGAKRVDSQLGLEATPEEYVANMVAVFREVRRVLRDDGTLWLNLGDSYAGSVCRPAGNLGATHNERHMEHKHSAIVPDGLKPKDLVGIPWRVAFALQADGWWLRQDIIWAKPNPMPESVTDRCTKSHEYIFLLSKSARYYFDNKAIKEPSAYSTDRRAGKGRLTYDGKRQGGNGEGQEAFVAITDTRNKRDVWTVPTKPFNGTKMMTDYVGGDGKPYTASPNCALHGHLSRTQKYGTPECDAQPNPSTRRIIGTGGYPASISVSESDATTSRSPLEVVAGNAPAQNSGSTPCCKTLSPPNGHISDAGNLSHNSRIAMSRGQHGQKTDCPCPACAETASVRSTQTNRNDHVAPTSSRDTASVQTASSTPYTTSEPTLFDSAVHNHENSTATDDLHARLSARKQRSIADNASLCNCSIVAIDHFATFPPALITPCVLAGCPAGGTVLDPFFGAGTTGVVAQTHSRNWIGIELNPEYAKLADERLASETAPMGLGGAW